MMQYSQPYGDLPQQQYIEQRTSVLAILSLVCSLICCIPGLGVLGSVFGFSSLVAIGRSDDRLVGRGLALAGIILGMIFTALWLGAAIGSGKVWGKYQAIGLPLSQKLVAMDQGDISTGRMLLTTEASNRISDADFEALRSGYQAELGRMLGVPTTFGGLVQAASDSRMVKQFDRPQNDAFPLVMNFEKGPGVVLLQIDTTGKTNGVERFANIIVAGPSGNRWVLWDPQRLPGGGATPTMPGRMDPQTGMPLPPAPDVPAPSDPAPTTPTTPDGPG